jgi:hypothetical protein
MSAPLLIGAPVMRLSTSRVTLPQRSPTPLASAPAPFKVLRTNRVPAQLSLFERPPLAR